MSAAGLALARRRQELVERSARQRAAFLRDAEPLARKAAMLDRMASSVRRYPLVVGVAVGLVALLGSRRVLDWTVRGTMLYTMLRQLRSRE